MLIKNSLLKTRQYKVLFYIYVAIVLYLTLSPINKIEPSFLEEALLKKIDKIIHTLLFVGVDKIVHTLLFIVFSVSYFLAYGKKYYQILIFSAIFGLIIEILQYILPTGRSFDLMDCLFDVIGGALGLLIISIFRRGNDLFSKKVKI